MLQLVTPRHRGFVIVTTTVPSGFLRFLEQSGLAGQTALTVEGVYLEPRVSMSAIVQAFERAGATVRGYRPAGAANGWQDAARAFRGRGRLSNPLAAEWLPTRPAA